MRILALCFLLSLVPVMAEAADAVSGDEIKLDDGRAVRLLGITAAGDAAKSRLQTLIDHQPITTEGDAVDRYGRIVADAYVQPGQGAKIWLQGDLLQQGLAFVYPPTGDEPHIADLFKFEHEARKAKRGLWNDPAYADQNAAEPLTIRYGHFAFVAGKVVKAERIKNKIYLNFGEDWRDDFTITIMAHDLGAFEKANIDPLAYQGKILRVRGWVKRDFGPMVDVTNPAQIEMLGESPLRP